MKKSVSILMSAILTLIITAKSYGQGECPGQHCSAKATIVNLMCKQLGNQGKPVFVEHNGSFCWCKCSCLASSIPVEQEKNKWKPIGDITVGETVLAIGKNGKWKPTKVIYSDGSSMPQQPVPYVIYITTENDIALIVTPEHLFLMKNGEFKRADRLTPNDKLLDKNKKELNITTLTSGSYLGPLHHIATTEWDETNLTKEGHLINTSGIISGDYFAELFLQPKSFINEPQIGSIKYHTKYDIDEDLGISQLKDTISFTEKFKFIPTKKSKDPENAIYYIPPGLDIAKENTLLPLDNTVPYEMALYLSDHFKVYYPNVIFHVDWNDNRVNAYAWRQNGRQYVKLLGGLIRHQYMKIEGISLVLAHEIGHHLGGPPKYPNNTWASCEGQADYWGALVGMRKVWFGQYAVENIDKGSVQLYNLFAYGLIKNLFEIDMSEYNHAETSQLNCSHPPAFCRLETYRAAMRADPKPSCAGK